MSGSIAAASATSATAATASGTRLAGDFNTFLTLLTTQLQNQSPTDPLDTNQMTNQLVQFASVEQQISMNRNLERLISLQQASQLTAAAPLVGRRVEVESERLPLQQGRAEVRLPAAGAAQFADIAVTDSAGRVLRLQTVSLGATASGWTWDGRDSNGRALADGGYGVRVAGRGINGEAAPLAFTVTGTVTGAERQGTDLTLAMGAVTAGFDRLRRLLPES